VRILVDGRYIADGFPGIGRATFNLLRALAGEIGQDELHILVDPDRRSSRHDVGALASIPGCHLVECSVPRFLPAEIVRLPGVVRRVAPDVFHAPFFLRPYGLPCPCVVNLDDLIPLHPASRGARVIDRIVFRIGARLACLASAAILVPSEATARAIREWEPRAAEKISVVPFAVDPWFAPRPAAEVKRVRHRLGLERPYVLHVGSAAPHKNTAGLLAVWARLQGEIHRPELQHELVVTGNPVCRPGPAGSNAVRFLGPVDEADLPALYTGADLFVSSSLVEGFGFTVVEAMACGTAVLCGNGGSLPEVTGDAASRIDPENPVAFAGAISHLLSNPGVREELAAKGQRRVRQLCWQRAARTVLRVYHRAAAS